MALLTQPAWSGLVAIVALFLLHLQPALSFDVKPQNYCSDQNTGAEGGVVSQWQFQSQGNCRGNCSDFALAIVQYDKCWCSDYIPQDQTDVGDCDQKCPGFPDDKCGNSDKGLFGYYELSKEPSGTQGASSTQPSSAPPSLSSAQDPTTVFQTVTESAPVVTITPSQTSTTAPTTMTTGVVSGDSSSAATSSPTSKSSADNPSTAQHSSVTSVEVTTIAPGIVSTKTIVLGPTTTAISQTEKKGTSVGAIAGGVVGGVVGIAAIVAGVFLFLYRRRKQQQQDDEGFESGVTRNTSTMSKNGLLRSEKVTPYPLPVATGSHRNSRMMPDSESISPVSGSDRRNSRPYLFDQRMNPSAIMSMDNNSRGSFVSMDDSRDYGRTLNVRNPDPDNTH